LTEPLSLPKIRAVEDLSLEEARRIVSFYRVLFLREVDEDPGTAEDVGLFGIRILEGIALAPRRRDYTRSTTRS
jgi:hypothetical protein